MKQEPRAIGARAPDVHGSERSEPTQTVPVTQPLHADAIATFAPWSDASERALRIRIHRARDSATARATRCKQGNARQIYWLAAQLASERVFARMPDAELMSAIENLARLFLVAGWIEREEKPDVE